MAANTPRTSGSGNDTAKRGEKWKQYTLDTIRTIVMVLSLGLIVFISYDTFNNIPFLENHLYMTFQFWVCMVFLFDFFLEFILADNKKQYLKDRWLFLLISIPYLNIIQHHHMINFSANIMYYIRFIPLIRGGYSLSLVVGYVSRNRALSLMAQYVVILLTLIYIASLMFYYEEYNVNPDVKSYWDALYFTCTNVTTVGCYFPPVTSVGKIITVVLPLAGTLILPLFTVVVINSVKNFDTKFIHTGSGTNSNNSDNSDESAN